MVKICSYNYPKSNEEDYKKYYENYSSCVAYKKRSPELFEAKYD